VPAGQVRRGFLGPERFSPLVRTRGCYLTLVEEAPVRYVPAATCKWGLRGTARPVQWVNPMHAWEKYGLSV